MGKPKFPVAVVMQRRQLDNRWQSEAWEPRSVIPSVEPKGAPRLLVEEGGVQQWLHPGFELVLHQDEAEGYYLNVSLPGARVFVLWRLDDDKAVPLDVTASYNEGGRWLDGGHNVDGVAMPPEIFAWVGEFVERNYRPEPKKRIKPRSFVHPKDRVG
ncbi:MAG TPA: DUF3305 domain-containing protein [Burkholderiales bacterium]|nr:DUF3305 domain-containing protein [Burkholderiales bacterium]